jgi:hypothetical protein
MLPIYDRKLELKEVLENENDIPTEKAVQIQSARIQKENEHSRRQKSFSSQKIKRKKKIISIGRIFVAFSSMGNPEGIPVEEELTERRYFTEARKVERLQ